MQTNGHVAPAADASNRLPSREACRSSLAHVDLAAVFASAAARHLLLIAPQVRRELAWWRAGAAEITDASLRRQALKSLGKHGNIEGAALFAILAPAARRRQAVRALVAFQTAYNYLDALSELPSEDPRANADQLHQALLTALHPDAQHADYYAHNPHGADGGYLHSILDACRTALAGLPSFPALAPTLRAAAARIVDFQTLNLTEQQGGHAALERWAHEATPSGNGLAWWETAAGAGSSLSVHALIAAAASARVDAADARAIDEAYYPWAGGLHSLLDSLVDREEDRAHGQRSLVGYYRDTGDAATRLGVLAKRTARVTECLPQAHAHRVILTAMCSYYLSAPQCHTPEARAISRSLTNVLGAPLNVAISVFGARRRVSVLTGEAYT
ncbi:MAG TPA: DUF2600 family protein [Solirubrobacteraceae bacterium]|nr:DUF2600 family protein [Solirubrobacteraceae bacterium]